MSDQFIDIPSSADGYAGRRHEGLGGCAEQIQAQDSEEPEHDDQETPAARFVTISVPLHVGEVAAEAL